MSVQALYNGSPIFWGNTFGNTMHPVLSFNYCNIGGINKPCLSTLSHLKYQNIVILWVLLLTLEQEYKDF